jgi:hypothetical protein
MEVEAASSAGDDRPHSKRRITRACLQCRSRKQRCLPNGATPGPRTACKRCHHYRITCSFETEQPVHPTTSRSGLAQLVVDLERRLNAHEIRIAQLEASDQQANARTLLPPTGSPISIEEGLGLVSDHLDASGPSGTDPSTFSIDAVDVGPPIATLQTLKAMPSSKLMNLRTQPPNDEAGSSLSVHNAFDPIARGIFSEEEASKALNIYFDNCHPSAPFLETRLRHDIPELQSHRSILLLAVCSVGARYWPSDVDGASIYGPHPMLDELTALLDKAISRLLLRPTAADVSLDTVRVLLLYVQWMPFNQDRRSSRHNEVRH